MTRPEPGITTHCFFERTRDGDTVEVCIGGSFVWAVRLANVWCPELRTGTERQQAAASHAFVKEILNRADPDELLVHVPLPKKMRKKRNLLKLLTFDRIPGYIWIGDVCLNSLIVEKGYASSTKGGVLGE